VLRTRRKRQYGSGAAEKGDEVAPFHFQVEIYPAARFLWLPTERIARHAAAGGETVALRDFDPV
jgi:hypothetical protein